MEDLVPVTSYWVVIINGLLSGNDCNLGSGFILPEGDPSRYSCKPQVPNTPDSWGDVCRMSVLVLKKGLDGTSYLYHAQSCEA